MDPNFDPNELGADPADGGPQFDDQPQGGDNTPDFRALFEQAEADRQRLAGELAQTRNAQQQQTVQQVDAMWKNAEGVAWQNTDQMDPDTAKAYMANFYSERDRFIKEQASMALRTVGVKAWRDELRKNYQLSDDDMQMLGDDPNMMEIHAKHIKRTRDQIEAVKQEHGITVAANRGRERLQTGAGVPLSGSRSKSGGTQEGYKPGTRGHLLALIESGAI